MGRGIPKLQIKPTIALPIPPNTVRVFAHCEPGPVGPFLLETHGLMTEIARAGFKEAEDSNRNQSYFWNLSIRG